MRARGIIIGAGIIGSAVAYELSRRGMSDLHVIDPDLEGSLSSTERNAGGVRHLWQNPVNIELARASIALFERIREEIGFQQSGYLWLYSPGSERDGHQILERTHAAGLDYQEMSFSDIKNRYPFIDKPEELSFGIFGPKDGLINSNALKNYYRSEAKRRGAKFHDLRTVTRISEKAGKPEVTTVALPSQEGALDHLNHPEPAPTGEQETWEADFIVLCAGAWARPLLSPLVPDPAVVPIRRQICFFKAENFDMTPYGMVVDTSRVYFHPEGGNILAGFVIKGEEPGYRFNYDADFFESHIWPALYNRSTRLERLKPISGWGGLYSYTPDTSGILGKIPGYQSLYEAHSFTGRGVMQSYGAALAVSDLILDGRFRAIDAAALSRNRFRSSDPSALLHEGLHI